MRLKIEMVIRSSVREKSHFEHCQLKMFTYMQVQSFRTWCLCQEYNRIFLLLSFGCTWRKLFSGQLLPLTLSGLPAAPSSVYQIQMHYVYPVRKLILGIMLFSSLLLDEEQMLWESRSQLEVIHFLLNGYTTDPSWATLVYFIMAIHFMELINAAD